MNKDTLDGGKEMVSEIENEDLPMLSFSPIVESFRFEETNEDYILHNILYESQPLVSTQVEYETYKFEEDNRKDDVQSVVLESFSFEENVKFF